MRATIKVLSHLEIKLTEHGYLAPYKLVYEDSIESPLILQSCKLIFNGI